MIDLDKDETLATIIPERLLFSSKNEEEDTTFKVIACSVAKGKVKLNSYGNITITGDNLDELKMNTPKDVILKTSQNRKYPDGFTARVPVSPIPESGAEQWKFLEQLITVNDFKSFKTGVGSLDTIINDINSKEKDDMIVANVRGYGYKKLDKLRETIKAQEIYANIYVLLADLKMTDNMIKRIYRSYKDINEVKRILKKNIYLFTNISGIGFKKIDEIYLRMPNSKPEDAGRIQSALKYYLDENQLGGNTKVAKRKLTNGTQALLDIKIEYINKVLEDSTINVSKDDLTDLNAKLKSHESANKSIVLFDGYYSTLTTFNIEWELYLNIRSRAMRKPNIVEHNMKEMIGRFEEKEGFKLSDEQEQFFLDIFKTEISFLIGNAGSGKTTSQKIMLQYAKETNQTLMFLAPTGMARKKLAEYTGHQALTIHSYLAQKAKSPDMRYDIYFVDESSMADVSLALNLLRTVPKGAKIVFAGDDGQIPSVSFGNFLYDCINNDTVFVNRYTKIFRQKEGGILDIVTRIRKGQAFLPDNFRARKVFGKNCVFDMTKKDGVDEVTQILTSYKNTMKTGKYKQEDVVVLVPTKKGKKGTVAINNKIQEYENPAGKGKNELETSSYGIDITYRDGDLVMNRKNDNSVRIFKKSGKTYVDSGEVGSIVNGDIGRVISLDNDDNLVYIQFDEFVGGLDKTNFNTGGLIHGWCITGHKSQGSEYKVVICLVDKSSSYQMNGNLLYTMTSRAKELLLVLGDAHTVNGSLKKFENLRRETNLIEFFKLGVMPKEIK